MKPFEFINAISAQEENPFTEEEVELYYNPWLTMDYFSKFQDCIFVVNEINSFKKTISKWEHYLYLFYNVRKRKRFVKWNKKSEELQDDINLVRDYFQYNSLRAKEFIEVIGKDKFDLFKKVAKDKGGFVRSRT